MKKIEKEDEYFTRNTKAGLIQIISNIILSIIKFLGGFLGRSNALISDGMNSLLDISTSLTGFISSKIASKKADENHDYGHDLVESLTCLILSMIMIFISIFFSYFIILELINKTYLDSELNYIALIISSIALIFKFILFLITFINFKINKSELLKTQAFDHFMDSIGTLLSLIGIIIIFLNPSNKDLKIIDPIISLIISLFIIIGSFSILIKNANLLLDKAIPLKKKEEIISLIKSIDGVIHIDYFRSRIFGSKILIEVEITVSSEISLIEAHNISETIRTTLLNKYKEIKHCLVHVNPEIHEEII